MSSPPRLTWEPFGTTQKALTDAMLGLFWEGLKDELVMAIPFLNRMIRSSRGQNEDDAANDHNNDGDDDDVDDDEILKSRITNRIAAAMEKWSKTKALIDSSMAIVDGDAYNTEQIY